MTRFFFLALLAGLAGCEPSVTRLHFQRSGGLAGSRAVSGDVELGRNSGKVTSTAGYSRDLSPEEVARLREAIRVKPLPSKGADAYQYAISFDSGGLSNSFTLTDASQHPLVPWLQKECSAIARASKSP